MARPDRQALTGRDARCAASIVVAYGSTFGTTEAVARQVADGLSSRLGYPIEACDVAWTDTGALAGHDVLILGASTWDVGHLQSDWREALEPLATHDLSGRRFAVFGCGDGHGYPDTFGDALGILRERLVAAGARPFGEVPLAEIGFDPAAFPASRARLGERLAGLLLEDAWDDARREAATEAWCDRLARELVGDTAGPRESGPVAGRLDDARVSDLLAASDAVLPLLVRYGFVPLANPALRAALAPTVTLAQAIRLRGLPDGDAVALRAELDAALGTAWRPVDGGEAATCR